MPLCLQDFHHRYKCRLTSTTQPVIQVGVLPAGVGYASLTPRLPWAESGVDYSRDAIPRRPTPFPTRHPLILTKQTSQGTSGDIAGGPHCALTLPSCDPIFLCKWSFSSLMDLLQDGRPSLEKYLGRVWSSSSTVQEAGYFKGFF